MSEYVTVNHGVPQGSILGPLLFNVYINDLPLVITHGNIDLYADDMTIYVMGQTPETVERLLKMDLKAVENWLIENQLVVNTKKSITMLLCTSQRRRSLSSPNLSLSLNGDQLKCVTSHKILGLIIDNNLSWDLHVKHVCSKLASILGLMWRYRDVMDHKMKILMYNSYFISQMDYCLNIWGSFEKSTQMEKIFRLQKRALRLIFSVDYTTPSSELFRRLNTMSIYQRCFYQ